MGRTLVEVARRLIRARTAPVGVGPITVIVDAGTAADDEGLQRLAELTERYCVVGQSLAQRPTIMVV